MIYGKKIQMDQVHRINEYVTRFITAVILNDFVHNFSLHQTKQIATTKYEK